MKTPYKTLLRSEELKKEKTRKNIQGVYDVLPNFYNVFIKLPMLLNNKDETDLNLIKIQKHFQFFIHDFPFKVRNIFNLIEIASYSDAIILFRSVIENFIVYKYYVKTGDGEEFEKYFNGEIRKTYKSFFESVVPGYYDDFYSLFSKPVHGNSMFLGIMRGNVSQENPLQSNINNINTSWSLLIINNLLPLILGVFNLYKKVYPENLAFKDEDLVRDLSELYDFIRNRCCLYSYTS